MCLPISAVTCLIVVGAVRLKNRSAWALSVVTDVTLLLASAKLKTLTPRVTCLPRADPGNVMTLCRTS